MAVKGGEDVRFVLVDFAARGEAVVVSCGGNRGEGRERVEEGGHIVCQGENRVSPVSREAQLVKVGVDGENEEEGAEGAALLGALEDGEGGVRDGLGAEGGDGGKVREEA